MLARAGGLRPSRGPFADWLAGCLGGTSESRRFRNPAFSPPSRYLHGPESPPDCAGGPVRAALRPHSASFTSCCSRLSQTCGFAKVGWWVSGVPAWVSSHLPPTVRGAGGTLSWKYRQPSLLGVSESLAAGKHADSVQKVLHALADPGSGRVLPSGTNVLPGVRHECKRGVRRRRYEVFSRGRRTPTRRIGRDITYGLGAVVRRTCVRLRLRCGRSANPRASGAAAPVRGDAAAGSAGVEPCRSSTERSPS
jgi:hypothetical protein